MYAYYGTYRKDGYQRKTRPYYEPTSISRVFMLVNSDAMKRFCLLHVKHAMRCNTLSIWVWVVSKSHALKASWKWSSSSSRERKNLISGKHCISFSSNQSSGAAPRNVIVLTTWWYYIYTWGLDDIRTYSSLNRILCRFNPRKAAFLYSWLVQFHCTRRLQNTFFK